MNIKEKIEYLKQQVKNYESDEEPIDGEELVNYGIYQGLQKALLILADNFDIDNDYDKEYILNVKHKKDGQICFESSNDGFYAQELLGFLEMKKNDIFQQIKGDIEPNIEYKRKVFKDETK